VLVVQNGHFASGSLLLFYFPWQINNKSSSTASHLLPLFYFAMAFFFNLNPFTCPQCARDFRSASGLTQHRNTFHHQCSPDQNDSGDEAFFTYDHHPQINGKASQFLSPLEY
jgi:hypothetical protein